MTNATTIGVWASQPVQITEPTVQASHAALIAWLVLNAWPSHLGLPVLVLVTLLSRKVKRHATFTNMCITWMIVGYSSCLLLYAGYTTGPEPPRLLCLVQASLLYGQPALTSLSTFALVFQVFYVVYSAFREKDADKYENLRKWALLLAPYVAFMIAVGLTAYVGITRPETLSRDRRFFYCSVKSSLLTNSLTALSFTILFLTTCLQSWIAYITYRHWRILKSNNLYENIGENLSLALRTTAFIVWIFLGMGLSLLSIKAPESPVPDIALATSSAIVLIFATQKDILHALFCFWRPDKERLRPSSNEVLVKRDLEASMKSSTHTRNKSIAPSDISNPIVEEDLTFAAFAVTM